MARKHGKDDVEAKFLKIAREDQDFKKDLFAHIKENDLAHQRSMENLTSTMQTVGNATGMSSLTQALRQPYPLATDQGRWSDTRNTLHPYTYLNAAGAHNFPLHADARSESSEDKLKTYMTLQ